MPNLEPNTQGAFNVADAARYVALSPDTLNKLRCVGSGPRFCRLGRSIRYRRADLDEWLEQNVRRSTSDASQKRRASA